MPSNQFAKMSDSSLNRYSFLGDWFFGSAKRYPDRIALVVGERKYSFSKLSNAAQNVALELTSRLSEEVSLVGLFGHRTAASFAGLLGILASGRGYVPINHKLPPARSVQILNNSGIRDIVVDVFF
jgi:acyl-CoA synthetase (AMP-forming)/AMP-acid ligase II